MSEASWRDDLRKLEGSIEELAGNLDVNQRQTGVIKLRETLAKEAPLSSADEELIQRFVDGACSFHDLALHFHGRL